MPNPVLGDEITNFGSHQLIQHKFKVNDKQQGSNHTEKMCHSYPYEKQREKDIQTVKYCLREMVFSKPFIDFRTVKSA
jgi:hypothetical protein